METVLLAVLLLLLIMGTVASTGWDVVELRNRENWWWTAVLMAEALLMENKLAGALLAMNIIGLWQIGRSWYVLRSTIIPMAGVAGFYAIVAPHMQLWMIPWLLWAGVAIGTFLAFWAYLGLRITRRPFRFHIPVKYKRFGMWGIYEDLDGTERHLCGQANRMHICSLSALAMACAAGLLWLGHWYAAPFFLLCYLPQHLNWLSQRKHPHVGHLCLIAVGLALICLWHWEAAALLTGGLVVGTCVAVVKEKSWQQGHWTWVDNGRLIYWSDVIFIVWWPRGWKARLFGFGTCSWFGKTCLIGERIHKNILTAAHNEYFQQMIEHGLIGLGVMLAYIGEALWRTATGTPEQQAVMLLGAAWCAMALVHFPATFFHEYHPITEKEQTWYGSPPLNVWTLIIALMAEAK